MSCPRGPAPVSRPPRPTLRRRLALFYAALFFASGAALLAIPLLSVKSTVHAGPGGQVTATAQHSTDVRQLVIGSASGLAVMAVLSLGLGWLIACCLLRPLRTITATARDISASNLNRRLTLGGRDDECTELGRTLNDLFGRPRRHSTRSGISSPTPRTNSARRSARSGPCCR